MPLYEYVCRACGSETEQLRKLSDPPLVDCPACGAAQMTKKVSAVGFRLKGGGWYETDFKKDGQRRIAGDQDDNAKKEGDKAPKDGGEGTSKSSDEKSASKPGGDKSGDKKSTGDKSGPAQKGASKTAS